MIGRNWHLGNNHFDNSINPKISNAIASIKVIKKDGEKSANNLKSFTFHLRYKNMVRTNSKKEDINQKYTTLLSFGDFKSKVDTDIL
jgi:hypothetical protein